MGFILGPRQAYRGSGCPHLWLLPLSSSAERSLLRFSDPRSSPNTAVPRAMLSRHSVSPERKTSFRSGPPRTAEWCGRNTWGSGICTPDHPAPSASPPAECLGTCVSGCRPAPSRPHCTPVLASPGSWSRAGGGASQRQSAGPFSPADGKRRESPAQPVASGP